MKRPESVGGGEIQGRRLNVAMGRVERSNGRRNGKDDVLLLMVRLLCCVGTLLGAIQCA